MRLTESFNKSFDEGFCGKLEYTLCAAFSNFEDEEIRRYWCDGVSWAPYYNSEVNREYLSYERVRERLFIETSARMGVSGQDRYEMKINLGKKSLESYKNETSLIDCIPSIANVDWIEIDAENCIIEINLL